MLFTCWLYSHLAICPPVKAGMPSDLATSFSSGRVIPRRHFLFLSMIIPRFSSAKLVKNEEKGILFNVFVLYLHVNKKNIMREKIDCFLPCSDIASMAEVLEVLRKSR